MGEQLAQDAAGGPHVDGRGLCGGVKEELWGPVPQGHHLGSHGLQGQAVPAGQPKVSYLDTAFVGHQEVGDLEGWGED